MDVLGLSQSQFAITTVYHFFFVPLTLGLSVLVAIMETLYVPIRKCDIQTNGTILGKTYSSSTLPWAW